MVAFYLDVHVHFAILHQLRRLDVDVVHAAEEGAAELEDAEILDRARDVGRVVFTQDIRFRAMAEEWQRTGRPFAGLAYGHQRGASIGQYIRDLELIAKGTEPSEWVNAVMYLPL
jgi:hypothetical protein